MTTPAGGVPDERINTIRNRLANTYSGNANVPTLYSNIDVLTSSEIIVIKPLTEWSSGIGLLHAHSTQFPNKIKHLHLYDSHMDGNLLNKVMSLMIQLGITFTAEQ